MSQPRQLQEVSQNLTLEGPTGHHRYLEAQGQAFYAATVPS